MGQHAIEYCELWDMYRSVWNGFVVSNESVTIKGTSLDTYPTIGAYLKHV